MKKINYSWGQFQKDCETLAKKVQVEEFDCIVGITRGGMFVASMIAEINGKKELYSIGYNSYKNTSQSEIRQTTKIHQELKNKKILLCDDIADTGKTLERAYLDLEARGNVVYTCTLHYSKKTCIMPNYKIKKMEGWVEYPFDYKN